MATKKKFGDRRDGVLIRDVDPLHYFTPLLYPNRCDNEAFISQLIDLTRAEEFLAQKNASNPEYKYNLFQLIVTAILKTITLRPKMNRFIANKNTYQRNCLSASFVVKKIFADDGGEALAFVYANPDSDLDYVHNEIYRQVSYVRDKNTKDDTTTESMNKIGSLPRFVSKTVANVSRLLDRHGLVPQSFIASDPYYATVVLTNLGSIKMQAGYHHLTNWGTNSVFVAVGEKKIRPFYAEDGSVSMKSSVDLGLTIDERIADGYYYSKTVRLLKYLLENPELLDRPMNEEVQYE